MKIVICSEKSGFTPKQRKLLSKLGLISYIEDTEPVALHKLLDKFKGADVIAVDPGTFGGFEKAQEPLTKVMKSLPNLRGVCLSTTSFGWVDLDWAKKNKIPVSNIPDYSKESVAESSIGFLLGAMKRIFVSDRRTVKGKYSIQKGFELKGKTLGIIGLGSIGSATAELAMGLGMKVIAYNRTPKKMKGVKMVSLNELFKQADAISLHTTHEPKNEGMIGIKELAKMKKGVFIVNTVDRSLVDEKAMAKALSIGQVDTYVYEAEDLVNTPLAKQENAIGFKGFAWYTKEALENLMEIWVSNIIAAAKGKPQNRVT